jgi:transcriptional regulator with XRE-family HTH domain
MTTVASIRQSSKAGVTPLAVARSLRQLGTEVATWRKLQRLTAAQLAERAGLSRDTLRSIEQGKGTASTENLFRALRIIGILDQVVAAADPYQTDVGRLRADEILPQRVRDDR